MTTSTGKNVPGTVDRSKVLSAAVLSVVGAAVANLITFFIVGLFYDAPDGFLPLTVPPILFFTVIGTSVGAFIYWLLSRRSDRPARPYGIIALVALILSIIPNIAAYFNPNLFPLPGGDPTAFLVLIIFHVVAAVASVGILINRSTY